MGTKHSNQASLCQVLQELPNLLVSQHSQNAESVHFFQDLPMFDDRNLESASHKLHLDCSNGSDKSVLMRSPCFVMFLSRCLRMLLFIGLDEAIVCYLFSAKEIQKLLLLLLHFLQERLQRMAMRIAMRSMHSS